MVNGYKCFNKGLINRYGDKCEIGKVYHEAGKIKYNKNGFHMCRNLEDTLRYFDSFNDDIDIASVTGYGEINEYFDDYNEFYNMYAVEYMIINRVLSREEIINYAISLPPINLKRFISLYRLDDEELELFKNKFSNDQNIMNTLFYYQDGKNKRYIKKK